MKRSLVTALLLLRCACARADLTDITAVQDNTIWSDTTAIPLSNGSGQHLFAGQVGENDNYTVRRALLSFSVADVVPPGAVINSASLRVTVSRAPPGSLIDPFTLHVVEQAWGEGASDASGTEGTGTSAMAGDATWTHTFYSDAYWTTPGGDFQASASATADIGGLGVYVFTSPQMAADVQYWLDHPELDNGWLLMGNEAQGQTVRRFYSADSGDLDVAPTLTIDYTVVPEPRHLFALGLLALVLYGRLVAPRRYPSAGRTGQRW